MTDLLTRLRTIAALVACMAGCRPDTRDDNLSRPSPLSSEQMPVFTDVTDASGVNFTHQPGEWGGYFMPEIMGGGAAMLDYDGDGDLDLYFVTGYQSRSHVGPATDGSVHRSDGRSRNRLFRQESDGRFTDASDGSGLDDAGYGMGVAVGDVNNDGFPDVYVTNYGSDRLLRNTGRGTFVDVTEQAGIDNRRWSASASFFDYDRDGWLDLFVTNYVDYQPGKHCLEAQGQEEYCNPKLFAGTPDKLYRNLGGEPGVGGDSVQFQNVTGPSGIADKLGAGLGVVCADFNGDHWPDIYVANDGHANFLWINQLNGTFREEAILLGAAYDRLGRGQASMGIAIADLNHDERDDLLLTHLEGETNAFYVSDAHGFQDASVRSGISAASFPYTGFGVVLLDLEHDGDLDLAVANGRIRRQMKHRNEDRRSTPGEPSNPWLNYAEPNQLLVNDGAGQFQVNSSSRDAFLQGEEVSRALVAGDIDNDGDLDLLTVNVAGPARLFRNDAEPRGNWLSIRAVDPRYGGRDAYGAVIVVSSGSQHWRRCLNPASSYLASHDPRVHFGLGQSTSIDRIEVVWPDGLNESFAGGPANEFRVVTRGTGEPL